MDHTCHHQCKNQAWTKTFVTAGLVSVVTAFCQSALQIFALYLSVVVEDIDYSLFFLIHTWITIAYMGYTIRLIYLTKCRRCSELSKLWWYAAIIVIIVNPSQSVWWLIHQDYIFACVSAWASIVYIIHFILVCRTVVPTKRKCTDNLEEENRSEEERFQEIA